VFVVSIWISVSSIYYSIVYIQQALITILSSIYYSIVDIQQALITVSIGTYGIPNCTIDTQNYYYSCQSDGTGVLRRSYAC
jgi:hypothetical protein